MDKALIAFLPVRLEEVEDNDDPGQRVLHDVDAQRLIVDAFEAAIAAGHATEVEAAEKPSSARTPVAQASLSARRWELVGRADAFRCVVQMLATVFAGHPAYRDEWLTSVRRKIAAGL